MPIYLLQAEGTPLFTIGYATNVEQRRKQLQAGRTEPVRIRAAWTNAAHPSPGRAHPALDPSRVERILAVRLRRAWAAMRLEHDWYEVSSAAIQRLLGTVPAELARMAEVQRRVGDLEARPQEPRTAEPTPETERLVAKLRVVKADRDDLDTEVAGLELELKALIGPREGVRGLATWRWQTRSDIDRGRLQQDFPAAWAACRVERGGRVLRLA